MASPTYDALIIGGGPAGSSAALTLVRQRHTVLLFDTGKYRFSPSLYLHGCSGSDHQTPTELIQNAHNECEKYEDFNLKHAEIVALKKINDDNVFEAKDKDGNAYRGRKVILANGVSSVFPQIEGYEICWGKGIFHNLFAQGYDASPEHGHAGVLAVDWLAMPKFAHHMSHFANQLVRDVTIYTNGNEELAKELDASLESKPWKSDSRKISCMKLNSPSSSEVTITFENGETVTEAFLGHSPISRSNGPFAEQLDIKLSATGEYEVNGLFNQTSVKGVYAAGDTMTMFKTISYGVATGALAGAGVALDLQEEKFGLPPVFG